MTAISAIEKLQPPVAEISWSKNLHVKSSCKDEQEREFYLVALDTQERADGENPPIGIIICRSKNKTVVEYALRTAIYPIGVASYTTVPQLPENYRDQLPSPEEIAERLQAWEDGR